LGRSTLLNVQTLNARALFGCAKSLEEFAEYHYFEDRRESTDSWGYFDYRAHESDYVRQSPANGHWCNRRFVEARQRANLGQHKEKSAITPSKLRFCPCP